MTTYYKFLNENGTTPQQHHAWKLPRGNRPGAWMPKITGELEPCENGYHLMRETDLIEWFAPALYTAEARIEIIESDTKIVARQARLLHRVGAWNETTARLFACDCAERALALSDKPDPRSVEAVRVSRLYARGDATLDRLAAAQAAAWAAAWDAARDAARDAAQAAAWAAAGDAAWDAAWAAARDAAWAAAWAAAGDAAWDAARAAA
ncbi:MAG: hypothetical protein HXY23_14365, partial [Parvularculaceae bacterium]|nr:hypothetical protein [Parvularculaceae bacterium]